MIEETAPLQGMSKEELAGLLKTPLNPDLDYFDATASFAAMAEHIRGLHKLIGVMFQSLTVQGVAIIDIRKKMVEHKEAIEGIGTMIGGDDPEGPGLVGFDKPKIVTN